MTTAKTYGIERRTRLSYEDAVERVTEALSEQGFGILTEIDVRATLEKKLGADFRRYVILGACNPELAHRALSTELDIGMLMPCNVIVYEDDDGGTVVSAMDPRVMSRVADNPDLPAIAEEARVLVERAIRSLPE